MRNDKIKGTTIAIVILSVVVIDRVVMIDVTKKMVLSHRNEVENEPAIFRSFCKEVGILDIQSTFSRFTVRIVGVLTKG